MKPIKLDEQILQEEADKVRLFIGRQNVSAREACKAFERQAGAVGTVADLTVQSMTRVAKQSMIETINATNSTMLFKPMDEMDFGHEPMDEDHDRFITLCEKTYVHETATGVFGRPDAEKAAKQAVRDYFDASILFYTAVLSKQGVTPDKDGLKAFVDTVHGFMDASAGQSRVVRFPAPKKDR